MHGSTVDFCVSFALSANIDNFPIGIAYGLRGMRIGRAATFSSHALPVSVQRLQCCWAEGWHG